MTGSGNTTTSQLPQGALELRFLTRTQVEIEQLRAVLPSGASVMQMAAIEHVERMAHKIASAAAAFGFPEIDAIAGAIELMAHGGQQTPARKRAALPAQLREKISALAAHVCHEIEEREGQRVPHELPLSAHLPGFGARRK
jgi:HPt (histidine-containing phosphotransfer) domain-containing protein